MKKWKTVTRLEYNHCNFDFDSYYRDINLYFIFDKENAEFIGSESNYHLLANNKFQGYGKPVPVAKVFCFIITRRGDQRIQQLLLLKN